MIRVGLFFILLMVCCPIWAQDSAPKVTPQPKVGLVLSGGGAKGLAHIGVLKVLEQAGVKVSFIGGTSMGAVVGGLYASGYNARQIDSIFACTDFDELLTDFVPRSSKSFYEKKNDEQYVISLPFQNFKIGIPTALSKGMYNYNLLTRLTHNVRHIRDFNQLPIPFLCMATDVETGDEILLDKGFLPQAMLASSAFPTLFSPVEIDGKILVDGGVRNNYPIDEIRKLGADIIIGVDVQDGLKDRTSLKDASKILIQITNLQMMEHMQEKIKKTDIYIKPEIKGFSVISFDDGKTLINKGEEAAFSVYEKLKSIAELTKPQNGNIKSNDSLYFKEIFINELENYTRSYVIGKIGFNPNKKINYQDLKKGIDNLTATQNFSSINYTIDKNEGADNLNLRLIENPIRTFVKFGLHYDGLYKTGILMNLTKKKIGLKNDVVSLDIILGDNFRYNLDYYIDNGFYWSFGFKSRLNTFNKTIPYDFAKHTILSTLNLNTINIDYSDFTNQAYLQTLFSQKFLIGGGLEYKELRIKSENLPQLSDKTIEDASYFSSFAYLKYDSLDNKYFPKKGIYFFGDIQAYAYSSNTLEKFNFINSFTIAKGEMGFVRTFWNKYTLKVQSEGGFSIGQESLTPFYFVLGGYGFQAINNFRHFYGYDFVSIYGDSYIKSTITLDYEVMKKHHLNIAANIANAENKLFLNNGWFAKPKYTGYAVGYGLETKIGPIEVKYTWSPETNKGYVWFNVGFWF